MNKFYLYEFCSPDFSGGVLIGAYQTLRGAKISGTRQCASDSIIEIYDNQTFVTRRIYTLHDNEYIYSWE